jgi:hypothetical protein
MILSGWANFPELWIFVGNDNIHVHQVLCSCGHYTNLPRSWLPSRNIRRVVWSDLHEGTVVCETRNEQRTFPGAWPFRCIDFGSK